MAYSSGTRELLGALEFVNVFLYSLAFLSGRRGGSHEAYHTLNLGDVFKFSLGESRRSSSSVFPEACLPSQRSIISALLLFLQAC
jgi:hypothetical protein